MTGETDLDQILATLSVTRRDGSFAVVSAAEGDVAGLRADAVAMVTEPEGDTIVVAFERAAASGFTPSFEAAWLTLDVHSSLSAVGLTAVVAGALGEVGIACNVLAGYFHDHLLVPIDRADEAIQTLANLAAKHP